MQENQTQNANNPIGLNGMEFVEFSSPASNDLESLFERFEFQKIAQHKNLNVSLYRQNEINFVINREKDSFAEKFHKIHGPSICSTGFRVENAKKSLEEAVRRGAKAVVDPSNHSFPAIYGIGGSLIYFVESQNENSAYLKDFDFISDKTSSGLGLLSIDHLTNNVPVGEMQVWCDFYERIFNFKEIRYFDIDGQSTGLISKVVQSPCGQIIIPINESKDIKSLIQEYLDEYSGA